MADQGKASSNLDPEALEFPCTLVLRVMGVVSPSYVEKVITVAERSAVELNRDAVDTRSSSKGNYVAVHLPMSIETRDDLEYLMRSLWALEGTKWVL